MSNFRRNNHSARLVYHKLADESLRSIAVWQVEGYMVDEIADRLGCTPRTVARKLAVIRDLWRDECQR